VHVFFTLLFLLTGLSGYAQSPYLMLKDPKHPEQDMAVGTIAPVILQNHSGYSRWYDQNSRDFKISEESVTIIEAKKNDLHFLVFIGTWCEDSQFIIPKFFKILSAAGFPSERTSLHAVDREKKMPGNLTGAMGISNVPTIIVMKNGKEIGRVVEYGKTGNWEKELTELIR
jgi:thiol-disulfide isomerase/thioredoxin